MSSTEGEYELIGLSSLGEAISTIPLAMRGRHRILTHLADNKTKLKNADDAGIAASKTIPLVLGVFVTDGLAKVASGHDYFVRVDDAAGNITAANLEHFIGEQLYDSGVEVNLTRKEWTENFLYELEIRVHWYGYGYGLRTKTVIFGITILLLHGLFTLLFMPYISFMFFCRGGWVSATWENMGDFAAMLINSTTADKLQNTCAGVEKLSTWRQRVKIRETAEHHLDVTSGDGKVKIFGRVIPQRKYSTIRQRQQLRRESI